MTEKLDSADLSKKINNLSGLAKRYYNFLPDKCWMTEEKQARKLKIGRTKLRNVKNRLIQEGLLKLELADNGNRLNKKHLLTKTNSIKLEGCGVDYFRYDLEDNFEDFSYFSSPNWSILQKYTAKDINNLPKLDQILLYMDCGFIVLPTHYPIFADKGVKCSCKLAFECSHKGKHPIVKYKDIDGLNYESKKADFLSQFRKNPNLNIGFKVMGFSVLDVDFRYNGHKTLKDLERISEIRMKGVLTVKSGNGVHIYADNKNLKNTAQSIGDGLDLRSESGFIVAPSSLHHSGNIYEWKEIGDLATIPNNWIEEEKEDNSDEKSNKNPKRKNDTAKVNLKDIKLPKKLTSDYVIEGGRRELTLFKWACRERGNGKNQEQIYDILITIRDTYCEDGNQPITDEEIKSIANSVMQYPTNAEKNQNLGSRS
ncbi:MAG: bifunctional DNA primase/polymerase [Pyrinomonadaceae bacterium]|nr:bifunctional DNA primase/polymerase [Pyrinomonadaceae bacterium]